jgi:hypothetical protein
MFEITGINIKKDDSSLNQLLDSHNDPLFTLKKLELSKEESHTQNAAKYEDLPNLLVGDQLAIEVGLPETQVSLNKLMQLGNANVNEKFIATI